MPIVCVDGEISDDDLEAWRVGPLEARLQLTCAQVRAIFCGPCLARGLALQTLTGPQFLKLFRTKNQRNVARRLMGFAARLSSERVRAVLASATWHQLRAASKHTDETAQIRAAVAQAVWRPGVKPHLRCDHKHTP